MPKASVSDQSPVTMVSPAGVRYSVETVTPELAEQWLTKNTDNRKIRRNIAERFGRDMSEGNWRENGEGICFAEDGTLINGQHRLTAVVLSYTSVPMLVVRELPMNSQDTMDDGAKRTMADTFGFHGIGNANIAAAITRRVLMWQAGYTSNVGSKYQPSKAEQLEAWRSDPSLPIAADAASQMSRRNLLPPSVTGLTWWLFWQIDATECAEFWGRLSDGTGLDETSPIYIVREQIILRNSRPGRVAETENLAWVIQAWNHYRAGKTLSPTYRYALKPGAQFPEPR